MTVDTERLQRLLGDDDLRWLLTRVRQRVERGQALHGQVTLNGVSRSAEPWSGCLAAGWVAVGRSQ
jgi:hypothetical protein